ncbi:MAG: hypothetical protein NW200_06935 [Hyphomonadaceae bacterium]|nr:hypothetical protein [Hyphomonadaceae bacterium]
MPIARLPRSILRVAGEDAGAFLDALLTNDVSAATADRAVYAALLTPQGKLIADIVAHRADDGALLLDVAAERGADLLGRLKLYRLRRRIDLDDASDAFAVVLRYGADATGPPDPRRPDGVLGARVLSTPDPPPLDPFPDFEAHRIRLGVPDPAVDAGPEEVFALEALLEEFHGVDFQKGCFIGQENVSRMKRRATTRRKFCRLAFDGAPPPFGAPITAGQAAIGEVRSGVAGCAIALVRLDRALEAQAQGIPLMAGDMTVRLDPPAWLVMPEKTTSKGDA